MSNNEALERDLQGVIYKHSTITGSEFQSACLRMAAGYYDHTDLECYCPPSEFASALARELERLDALG